MRDSLGIRVIENGAPLVGEVIQVGGVPEFVVPPDFGSPDHYLFGISGMVALPSGRWVAGNSGTQQLFVFDQNGGFIRAVGRKGEGPGELQAVWGLATCAEGTIAVREVRRVSLFGPDGEFRGTVRISGHLAESRAVFEGISPDCRRALLSVPSRERPVSRDDLKDLYATYYWASLDTGVPDTVTELNVRYAQARDFRGQLVWSRVPYGPEGVLATHGERLVVASGRTPEVSLLDKSGAPEVIIRWDEGAEPVTDADWAHFTESRQELIDEHPEEAALVPEEDFYFRPETKPAVAEVLVDDEGRIWVGSYGTGGISGPSPSGEWSVFDPSGRWLARVMTPEGFTVHMVAQGRVMGTARDDMDAQRIEAYRLPDLGTSGNP